MRRARTASGGSEEAARDTARPRTEDLEDGVPLPLRAHGLEALRALAAASANTAERRVQKKNIQFDAARSSWQHLFDPSKSDSLVARGYATKGSTGADYGRYWITAAGLEYFAAVNDGESIARNLKEAAVFACATPAHGYQDEFDLFVAAKGPRDRVIETLPADQEINGINFKKGRLLVYCHDLARVHEDPDRRSFVLEPTLRAVEARMGELNFFGPHCLKTSAAVH
ncbi:hypothetical protein SO694_00114012 [Aureococcus anophagefferens]|uniref:Uncharacterized protein n=1 Tax=Aureococcus anophagefferens TaxID=44056 RepID=A0ABR1FWR9_AURAN|nr:hypothetical protein JL721_8090 [Aureococcus anophagefferens]KAH8092416.1 hypothetical protein JL720_5387 [Aureococcus anophagefferens]